MLVSLKFIEFIKAKCKPNPYHAKKCDTDKSTDDIQGEIDFHCVNSLLTSYFKFTFIILSLRSLINTPNRYAHHTYNSNNRSNKGKNRAVHYLSPNLLICLIKNKNKKIKMTKTPKIPAAQMNICSLSSVLRFITKYATIAKSAVKKANIKDLISSANNSIFLIDKLYLKF